MLRGAVDPGKSGQEQRAERSVAYWLASPSLLSVLSYTTQPTFPGLGPLMASINQDVPQTGAQVTLIETAPLRSGSLFSGFSSFVKLTKTDEHTGLEILRQRLCGSECGPRCVSSRSRSCMCENHELQTTAFSDVMTTAGQAVLVLAVSHCIAQDSWSFPMSAGIIDVLPAPRQLPSKCACVRTCHSAATLIPASVRLMP